VCYVSCFGLPAVTIWSVNTDVVDGTDVVS